MHGGERARGSGSGWTVAARRSTNALSGDGSRVFWTASTEEGKIYLRENPFGEGPECAGAASPCSIAVSADGEALSGKSASRYWAAARDGSAAIFTSGKDLYEFEVEGEVTRKIAGGVFGVMGASEDAKRVYFASTEVLKPGEENGRGEQAETGQVNLYLHEAGAGSGAYRFIGQLASGDGNGGDAGAAGLRTAPPQRPGQRRRTAGGVHHRGAAGGRWGPGAYDNTDAASPEACGKAKGICDSEVFLYGADAAGAAAGAGELLCVSCNPSAARPAGALLGTVVGEQQWVAGRLPVFENALYGQSGIGR